MEGFVERRKEAQRHLSVDEVAARLDRQDSYVRRMIRKGQGGIRLRAVMLGNAYSIHPTWLDEWIEAVRVSQERSLSAAGVAGGGASDGQERG